MVVALLAALAISDAIGEIVEYVLSTLEDEESAAQAVTAVVAAAATIEFSFMSRQFLGEMRSTLQNKTGNLHIPSRCATIVFILLQRPRRPRDYNVQERIFHTSGVELACNLGCNATCPPILPSPIPPSPIKPSPSTCGTVLQFRR